MDTRTKIIDSASAARCAEAGAIVVSGFFDPLIASTAERLAACKDTSKPLLVVIASAPDAILPARARAELVAGLACVDFVCEHAPEIAPQICLQQEHHAALSDLIRHVNARQQAVACKTGR